MKQDIKLVRKQFRMTRQEESVIKDQQINSFSAFVRHDLLKSNGIINLIQEGKQIRLS